MRSTRVLVIDDEPQLRTYVKDGLLELGYEAEEAGTSAQALGHMARKFFDLVVCDVRMPHNGGIEFLKIAAALHPETGFVLMSGIHNLDVAVEAMRSGALDYVCKPFTIQQIATVAEDAIRRMRERTSRNLHTIRVEESFIDRGLELARALSDASESTLNALVAALDVHEHETEAHSRRVGEYAMHLAGTMGAIGPEKEDIRKGALLHDIGKIGISDRILLKPSKLNAEEWIEMRRHPEMGYWILIGSPGLRGASAIVLSHHERWDGNGYPNRLRGANIPLGARIFSVVDALDALTSDRPYHRGETYENARKEIEKNAGTQFDPDVVEHFLRVPPAVWQDIRSQIAREDLRIPGQPRCAATA